MAHLTGEQQLTCRQVIACHLDRKVCYSQTKQSNEDFLASFVDGIQPVRDKGTFRELHGRATMLASHLTIMTR